MNPLLLIGLAYALTLKRGAKTADKLEYFPKKFAYNKTTKTIEFVMEILNPTNNKLTVDSFFGGIFSNDSKIGSIEKGTPFVLQKNMRTEVRFPVKPVGTGIAKAIADAIRGKKPAFKVMGTVRALGIDTAVNEELPLEI